VRTGQKCDSIDCIFAFPEWQVIRKLGLETGLGRLSRANFEETGMPCNTKIIGRREREKLQGGNVGLNPKMMRSWGNWTRQHVEKCLKAGQNVR
jgi:hypothetical protein